MKALSFFRSISFKGFKPFSSQAKDAAPAPDTVEQFEAGELGYILPVTAKHSGGSSTFQLLVSHLTPHRMIFRTDAALKDKDCLQVDILLQGVGNISVTAQVQFVVMASLTRVTSPRGHVDSVTNAMFSGQLELWGTDRQQDEIRKFLRRNTTKQRSTIGG